MARPLQEGVGPGGERLGLILGVQRRVVESRSRHDNVRVGACQAQRAFLSNAPTALQPASAGGRHQRPVATGA